MDAVASALGERCRRQVPLGPRTTYQVGGVAALFFEAVSVEDLRRVASAVNDTAVPVAVLGRGSNLLVADAGFGGLVVALSRDAFGHIATVPPDGAKASQAVVAGAATPLPVLARQCAAAGLTGLEWAVGVPGSVGGGVRMNAGGHGADTESVLACCQVVDLATASVETWTGAQLGYGYRHSALGEHHVVVDATYRVTAGDPDRCQATIREVLRWRREHQPGGQNAGSVFINPGGAPPANSAGWLVDAAGLKGRRHGSAMVSPKHANFIQADPGGSADDVVALMMEVQHSVEQRFGVLLRAEVRLLGFPEVSVSTLG